MLRGNYQVLNRSPGRFLGGSVTCASRSNFNGPGASRNFAMQDGATNLLASIPSATEPPYCWVIPQFGGALGCYVGAAGAGEITNSNLAMGLACDAALIGLGDLTTADLGLIVSLAAALVGTGDITTADLQAILDMAANVTGTGTVSAAALTAIGHLAAALTGTGSLTTASMSGLAELEAEINVTGDLLTTATVGSAVWSTLIEAGFDAARIMRIIAAATAGESTGGPTSPVFRDLADTEDMISGSADGNGDRSAITYGG